MSEKKYKIAVEKRVVESVKAVLTDREIIEVLENLAKDYIQRCREDCIAVDLRLYRVMLDVTVYQMTKDDGRGPTQYPCSIPYTIEVEVGGEGE